MQTLGLSSEPQRTDGRLKSLLWPTVENAWDVDYLGQQGMWICTLVGVVSLILSVLSGNLLVTGLGVVSALFYVIGGMGVRQVNWPAAALIFVVYSLDLVVIASEWRPAGEGEDRPTRFNETLADKYVDQLPARCWPILQIPFIVMGITMLLFTLAALGFIFANRFGLLPHR